VGFAKLGLRTYLVGEDGSVEVVGL